eukprot:775148-Pelagomonas_calceolata.AAC.1
MSVPAPQGLGALVVILPTLWRSVIMLKMPGGGHNESVDLVAKQDYNYVLRKRYSLVGAGLWIVLAKVGMSDGSKFTTEMRIGSDEFGTW